MKDNINELNMANYVCNKWGMSVKDKCVKCDERLLNDILKIKNK